MTYISSRGTLRKPRDNSRVRLESDRMGSSRDHSEDFHVDHMTMIHNED